MRIAILAPTAAPAFLEDDSAAIGGAERQLAMLGRHMIQRGHEVDVLVAGGGGEAEVCRNGRVWPGFPLGGAPLLKLVHPKGSSLLRFLAERGSEVLLQRGASELTALAAVSARLRGIPFVFMLASDRDLESGREILPHPQDRVLFHESIREAKRLVAQTRNQARKLWRVYGLRAEVLPSFLTGESGGGGDPSQGESILWGGNIRRVKRPEWLLYLARHFPEREFLVFGAAAPGSETYCEGLVERFKSCPNLRYLGSRPPAALPGLFRRARVLINSSEAEGFPNTFLEAWQHGLDVIASVDPDGILRREGLGFPVSSKEEMAEVLSRLLAAPKSERELRARKARAYLIDEHDPTELARCWERLLEGLVPREGELLAGAGASLAPSS